MRLLDRFPCADADMDAVRAQNSEAMRTRGAGSGPQQVLGRCDQTESKHGSEMWHILEKDAIGGVAEWSKATVLKTVAPQKGAKGSNPFSSSHNPATSGAAGGLRRTDLSVIEPCSQSERSVVVVVVVFVAVADHDHFGHGHDHGHVYDLLRLLQDLGSHLRSARISSSTKHPRRGGREAEGGGLLNRYTGENLYREFESHPLRQN